MKIYAIVCQVLSRECFHSAAHSPHSVTISIKPSNLHDKPDDLRKALQDEIDEVSKDDYDYIVMAYGLCSRGTAELSAKEIPLVIPRAHDCITLLLGSKERYQSEFTEHPGTYYYSSGWIEYKDGEMRQGALESIKDRVYQERYQEYVEKYGEDNAVFLMEQEQQWLNNYNRAALIDTGLGDIEKYREYTRRVCDTHEWAYAELEGEMGLTDRLFSGNWDDESFLIVQPGQCTEEAVNAGIITCT